MFKPVSPYYCQLSCLCVTDLVWPRRAAAFRRMNATTHRPPWMLHLWLMQMMEKVVDFTLFSSHIRPFAVTMKSLALHKSLSLTPETQLLSD